MIERKTVFVLGAGASWHYGYPTGEELVSAIVTSAARLSGYCTRRKQSQQVVQIIPEYVAERMDASKGVQGAIIGWDKVYWETQLLMERLQAVRPLLIDHFLAWNETLRSIGKLLIASAILECEASLNIRQDWYRFIVHKLVYGCANSSDLFKNNVHFVIFNYDTSLEFHLFRALSSLDILSGDDVERFLSSERIVHPYGSVHVGIPNRTDFINGTVARELGQRAFKNPPIFDEDFLPPKKFLDACYSASKNLKTIDPYDKELDGASLATAQKWIADAEVVYILGYGFDASNSNRIGLTALEPGPRTVMFTNYGDLDTVNKKASQLFGVTMNTFAGATSSGVPFQRYYEKSVRNVYEALAKDFQGFEEAADVAKI